MYNNSYDYFFQFLNHYGAKKNEENNTTRDTGKYYKRSSLIHLKSGCSKVSMRIQIQLNQSELRSFFRNRRGVGSGKGSGPTSKEGHCCGISATGKRCGAAGQAPAQVKVRTAQAGTGSGEVGSGVLPVLAQWYLGDLQQAVQWAQVWFCKERRHLWIFFKMREDRVVLQIHPEQHRSCLLVVPVGCSVSWMHRHPKSHPRVFWGFIWVGWEYKRWPLVQKSTVGRSRPVACNVLSTIMAISKY